MDVMIRIFGLTMYLWTKRCSEASRCCCCRCCWWYPTVGYYRLLISSVSPTTAWPSTNQLGMTGGHSAVATAARSTGEWSQRCRAHALRAICAMARRDWWLKMMLGLSLAIGVGGYSAWSLIHKTRSSHVIVSNQSLRLVDDQGLIFSNFWPWLQVFFWLGAEPAPWCGCSWM